jgi:hypothetical protein
MASSGSKAESAMMAVQAEALDTIHQLQQCLLHTDSHLQKVEEAGQFFSETQKKIDDKMDNICLMLQNWPAGSELGSADHFSRRPFSPSPPLGTSSQTVEELAMLQKQQAEGKTPFQQPSITTSPHTR